MPLSQTGIVLIQHQSPGYFMLPQSLEWGYQSYYSISSLGDNICQNEVCLRKVFLKGVILSCKKVENPLLQTQVLKGFPTYFNFHSNAELWRTNNQNRRESSTHNYILDPWLRFSRGLISPCCYIF